MEYVSFFVNFTFLVKLSKQFPGDEYDGELCDLYFSLKVITSNTSSILASIIAVHGFHV